MILAGKLGFISSSRIQKPSRSLSNFALWLKSIYGSQSKSSDFMVGVSMNLMSLHIIASNME